MKPRELLQMEADLQRHTLRSELDEIRQHPASLIRDVTGGGLGALALTRLLPRLLPRLLGRRAPWLVYGWLGVQAWRRLFPPGRPPRR